MEPTREQWYQRRIAELEAQVRQRDERIAALERQVAQLAAQVAKLSKNSSNSSKPPSSDIVNPPPQFCLPGRERLRDLGPWRFERSASRSSRSPATVRRASSRK